MTDGLSDALGSGLYAAMQDAVLHADTPESAARTLIARAGGVCFRDDMSAIVSRFSSCLKNALFRYFNTWPLDCILSYEIMMIRGIYTNGRHMHICGVLAQY